MKTKVRFFIDQQFGHPIWIDVEKGIITKFPNNGKMEDRLNELYIGKSIFEFKKEFEAMMKPAWYCVKSEDLVSLLIKKTSINTQQHSLTSKISHYSTTKDLREALTQKLNEYNINEVEINKAIELTKAKLKEIHNFDVDILNPYKV